MPEAFRVLGGDIIPTSVGDINLQISVAPDPYKIQLELERVAANLENLTPPLVASARILADDTQQRFDTETDPDGDAWIPLDEEYLANKESLGYPPDILHRTGDLEKAATNIAAYRVVNDSVFFETSGLPPYGLLHQVGSGDPASVGMAAVHRQESRLDPEHRKREGGPHSNQAIGRGQALPARPFIGMSEQAEGKIWEVFNLWFDEATEIYIHPGGTVQSIVRTPKGPRFGPKIIL